MDTQNGTNHRRNGISGESTLAIISVALAAFWIAFAFYKGGSPDENGNRIMLLHPLIPVALIGLLMRIYRWVGIKFVVQLEIILIGVWILIRMLGILMPFILGFGFAYLFRFLWKAMPLNKIYQRVIATVLIILICSGALILTGFGVRQQVEQMARGLQKFYHESLLPLVVGEEFTDFTSYVSNGTETLFLGTNHGIYILEEKEKEENKENDKEENGKTIKDLKRIGITNGELLGKHIHCIAVSDKYIYAGTQGGIYRCSRKIVDLARGKTKGSLIKPDDDQIWKKMTATRFDDRSIVDINIPSWNNALIYVGTELGMFKGVYSDDDVVEQWEHVEIDGITDRPIVSIDSIERFARTRKDQKIYLVSKKVEKAREDELNDTQENIGVQLFNQFMQMSQQTPVEELNETDETPEMEETNTETATVLHETKHTAEFAQEEWTPKPINIEMPEIKTLIATDKSTIQLYAGTLNGLYARNDVEKWNKMPSSDRLPKNISLLATASSGLYAGNSNVIHYSPDSKNNWRKFTSTQPGILMYRDDPYVKQLQAYLTEKIPGWTASGGAFIRWLSGLAGSIAFQFGGFIATLFLAFIVFVYASQGFDKYFHGFISLIPERHQETTKAYFREIDNNMHQFLKGQFTVIVIITIISCIVYRLIGVPFALLVGILAGICNAIPTFGPFIGGGFATIAMLMGLAAGEFSSTTSFAIRCLGVLGAILGIQAIDNSLISPKVMSNAVDVDPLLIMFSVIVGASILGFWGVLLAIPIIVVIKSIITVSKANGNGAETHTTQEQT
ncbi:AI-2E family transporter [Candidatus Poribacteria bacterium]|nr:AI-2E family transporter [Candidatus Poribacteria bacterium]MYI93764.1 AI-2E family transporter [Candidatus Poribacteria bacterium]